MTTSISPDNTTIKNLDDKQLREMIVEAAQNKKAKGITVINLESIADNIREELLDIARVKPYNYDGYRNAQWIVIDYGSTMVHVFTPDARQLYNLEELWNDAIITEIPDLD